MSTTCTMVGTYTECQTFLRDQLKLALERGLSTWNCTIKTQLVNDNRAAEPPPRNWTAILRIEEV